MTRHKSKTITIHLPPPTSFPYSSSSSSSASSSSSTMPELASLDVLLQAQTIAKERNTIFDIESFLTPKQRETYYTTILKRSPPRPPPTKLPYTTSIDPPTPSSKRPIDDVDSTNASPAPEDTTPKKPKIPIGLAGLHWKQRQKKLAEIARLEAEGEKFDPDTLLPIGEVPSTPAGVKKEKGETKPESLVQSASYWNHLLVQARRERGPQWDYHSQSFQFDKSTQEYYTHNKPPRPATPPPAPSTTTEIKAEQAAIASSSSASASQPTQDGLSNGTSQAGPSGITGQSLLARRQSYATDQTPMRSATMAPTPLPTTTPQRGTPSSLPSQSPYSTQQLQTAHQGQQPSFRPQTAVPAGHNPMPTLTPQQIASLQSLSNAPGGLNPAMLQMARAAGLNVPQGGHPGQMMFPNGNVRPGQGQAQFQGISMPMQVRPGMVNQGYPNMQQGMNMRPPPMTAQSGAGGPMVAGNGGFNWQEFTSS